MCTSGVNRQNEFVFYKQMLKSGNRCFSLFNKPLHLSHKRGRENRVRCAGGGSKVSKFLRYGKEPDEVCIMLLSSLALERNLLFAFHLENIRIIECYPTLALLKPHFPLLKISPIPFWQASFKDTVSWCNLSSSSGNLLLLIHSLGFRLYKPIG